MKYLWPLTTVTKVFWYSKHEFTHILIGLVYAWFLRELWGQFSPRQIFWSVFGSLVPDFDHLIYFFFYGRTDPYSIQVKKFLREGNISSLIYFVSTGHKNNTNLWSHNIYIVLLLMLGALVSFQFDWKVGIILFGSMIFHFVFDVVEDLIILGTVNPNWRRWGRGSSHRKHQDTDPE